MSTTLGEAGDSLTAKHACQGGDDAQDEDGQVKAAGGTDLVPVLASKDPDTPRQEREQDGDSAHERHGQEQVFGVVHKRFTGAGGVGNDIALPIRSRPPTCRSFVVLPILQLNLRGLT
eukprot:766591-Hanusia_phi.AAC.3